MIMLRAIFSPNPSSSWGGKAWVLGKLVPTFPHRLYVEKKKKKKGRNNSRQRTQH
jgi:hypothetical protein